MKQELSDQQIKAAILGKLKNRGYWGARYTPLDSLVRWLSKKIRRNGKRIRELVNQLVNDGYVLLHKQGATISLNPRKSEEIIEYIRRF